MSEEQTKTWDEAQIRCAINYTLERCIVLWPFFNNRYKIQNKVIEWLETFGRDAAHLAMKREINEKRN